MSAQEREQTELKQALEWWGRKSFARDWNFHWRAIAAPDDGEHAWRLCRVIKKHLLPLGLIRCRSLAQLGYRGGNPNSVRVVVDWSGDDFRGAVYEALGRAKLWPISWPEDLVEIAIDREDWHYAFPPLHTGNDQLFSVLLEAKESERLSILENACLSGPPFDIWPAETEHVAIDGQKVIGSDEATLRSDAVSESQAQHSVVDASGMIRLTEAAEIVGENKGTISRWIERGWIKDNGRSGHDRRILVDSLFSYCREHGIAMNER